MQSQSSAPNELLTRKASVLIVDDEPDILTVFKQSLDSAGYSTYGFVNPVAALEHFTENPQNYQFIISDIRMPRLSGFELAREARKVSQDVKIVLMSAFEIQMHEFNKVLPSTRVDALLTKPVTTEKLKSVLETLAEQKSV